jgi:HSP20 family protein
MNTKPKQLPVFFWAVSDRSLQVSWQPSADVYRTRDGWLVKLDVAGVKLEDIAAEITANGLRVTGYRRDSIASECVRPYSMEISYNRFERNVQLPCSLAGAKAHLECRDGILLVRLITEGETSE